MDNENDDHHHLQHIDSIFCVSEYFALPNEPVE